MTLTEIRNKLVHHPDQVTRKENRDLVVELDDILSSATEDRRTNRFDLETAKIIDDLIYFRSPPC